MLKAKRDTFLKIGDSKTPFKKGEKVIAEVKGKTLVFDAPINGSYYWMFIPEDWE